MIRIRGRFGLVHPKSWSAPPPMCRNSAAIVVLKMTYMVRDRTPGIHALEAWQNLAKHPAARS